jgi:amino acid adenylation domain-containing protein
LTHGAVQRWRFAAGRLRRDDASPPSQPAPMARVIRQLAPDALAAVHQLTGSRPVETTIALLSVLEILLSLYQGTEDVVVDAPQPLAAGGQGAGSAASVSVLVNRADSLRDIVLRTDAAALAAWRSGGGHEIPTSDVRFSYEPAPGDDPVIGTHDIRVCARGSAAIELAWTYRKDCWPDGFIEAMADRYGELVAMLADPSLRCSAIEPCSARSIEQRLGQFKPVAASGWGDTLHGRFTAQAAQTPDAIALIDGAHRVSYRALDAASARLARHLHRRFALIPDHVVAVLLPRSWEAIVAILAVLRAGAAYLFIEADSPAERIRTVLAQSSAHLVVTRSDAVELLLEFPGEIFALDVERDFEAEPPEPPPTTTAAHHLAYLIATSGSTGVPKLVAIEHRNVMNYLCWKVHAYRFGPGDAKLQLAPLSFDSSVSDVFSMLACGGTVVLASFEDRLSPAAIARLVRTHSVTSFAVVPSLFRSVVLAIDEELPSLRAVTLAGERVTEDLVRRQNARFPHLRLVNEYGPSECAIGVTAATLAAGAEPTIGTAIDNVEILVLDGEGRIVPDGVVGELAVAGAALGRGYLGGSATDRERFAPHRYRPVERIYRTGDLALRGPDGDHRYCGRCDEQVKVRGNRVELGEVERTLLQHAAVQQAAVAVWSSEDEGVALAAYCVTSMPMDERALRAHLGQRLPAYMVPQWFVSIETMPLNRNGKLERGALPDPRQGNGEAGGARPANPLEEALCLIWAEVFQRQGLHVEEDFFALGGHSLRAARIVAAVGSRLQIDASVREVFQNPSVRAMAAALMGRQTNDARPSPLPDAASYPASAEQAAIWLHQCASGAPAGLYNIVEVFVGQSDPVLLRRALTALVQRHEILRTTFSVIGGELRQIIHPEARLEWREVDLRNGGEEGSALRAIANAEATKPLSLHSAPPWRLCTVLLASGEHVLLWTLHHVLVDAWSMRVLLRELALFYRHARHGTDLAALLPGPDTRYRDVAGWQRMRDAGPEGERARAWWKGHFRGFVAPPRLPTDRVRTRATRGRAASLTTTFPRKLVDTWIQSSRLEGITLSSALLAAVKLLVSRYKGADDGVVGTVVSSRDHSWLEDVVGPRVRVLPLRDKCDEDVSFSRWALAVQQTLLTALEHQGVALDEMHNPMSEDGVRGGGEPCDVVVSVEPWDELDQSVEPWRRIRDGMIGSQALFDRSACRFEWTLAFVETPEGLQLEHEYDRGLFEERRVARFASHLESIMRQVSNAPATPLHHLSHLPEEEEREVRECFARSGWGVAPADGETLVSCFERSVDRAGDAVALHTEAGTSTYLSLDRQANAIALELRSRHGIGEEDRVAICAPRSPDYVLAILGVLKAGAAYVPIDPGWPEPRRMEVVRSAGCKVVLAHAAWHIGPGVPLVLLEAFHGREAERCGIEVRPGQLAYVVYTSGSTGRPKGVMVEHRSVVNLVRWHNQAFGVQSGHRASLLASVAVDASVWEMWPSLIAGASLVPFDDAVLRDSRTLADALTRWEITHAFVPTPVAILLCKLDALEFPPDLVVLTGGDTLELESSPPFRLANNYGPTETTVVATSAWIEELNPGFRIPIGAPIPGIVARVLDRRGRHAGIGIEGELLLGGIGVARGYLGDPVRTGECFVPDPFSPGDTVFRTGDRVRWTETGALEFLGRRDRQVKIDGFRVELGEVESALSRLPGVDEIGVAAVETGGLQRLVAWVSSSLRPLPAPGELFDAARSLLPAHMIPHRFEVLTRLPHLASGKIDRTALHVSDLPSPPTAASLAVAHPVDRLLHDLWTDALGASVPAGDDFFAAGGRSLSAMRLLARVHEVFGVDYPARDFFAAPTREAMAAHLKGGHEPSRRRAADHAKASGTGASHPLTFAQESLWRLARVVGPSPFFNIHRALRVHASIDRGILREALQLLAARQTALRTIVRDDETGSEQRVIDLPTVPFDAWDLRDLAPVERAEGLRSLRAEHATLAFTVDQAPPWHLALLEVDTADSYLLLTSHHILMDDWASRIFFRELGQAYEALRAGLRPAWPALELQFGDIARWQRECAGTQVWSESLAAWHRTLRGPLPATTLFPGEGARSGVHLPTARSELVLDESHARFLRSRARQERVTPFIVFAAGVLTAASRRMGEGDVRLAFNVANRDHASTHDLIGLFVNTVIVRVELKDVGNPGACLAAVRRAVLDAWEHREMPFELLVEAPPPSTTARELFSIMLVFDDEPEKAERWAGLPASFMDDLLPAGGILTSCQAVFAARLASTSVRLGVACDAGRIGPDEAELVLREVTQALFTNTGQALHPDDFDNRTVTP